MKSSFKLFYFYASIFFIIIISTFVIGEIFLRIFLIPGIGLEVNVYDDRLGLFHAKPNSCFIRTNVRGEKITRKANSFGFYDKNFNKIKPKNIFRIGFFGDSFTESIQVPLERTFFRIIEDSLKDQNVETLAFGKSGHGAYHAYLKHKYFSNILNIDKVVYVFFRNDIHDQYYPHKKSNQLPYPEFQAGKLISNNSYLNEYLLSENNNTIKKFLKNSFLYHNSILLQTLRKRLYFLMNFGISLNENQDGSHHFGLSSEEVVDDAKSLFESVILHWKNECSANGKEFSIFYVPDKGEYTEKDLNRLSWKPWLESFCVNSNIEFIDPSNSFLKLEKQGITIYDDHFSELGHLSFADTFINKFREERSE